jgi:hypothetical protein
MYIHIYILEIFGPLLAGVSIWAAPPQMIRLHGMAGKSMVVYYIYGYVYVHVHIYVHVLIYENM